MITFLAAVFVFGLLVFAHEAGHFLVAKAVGVKVYEFALGFGPRLIGKRWGGTLYSIRLLPLGGFVKLAGMDEPEEESELVAEDAPSNFKTKPLWQRMAIIAAGPAMNVALAICLFAFYFGITGIPLLQVGEVEPDSPAAQAGLRKGDIISGINSRGPQTVDQVIWTINESVGKTIMLYVNRENKKLTLEATPRRDFASGRGLLGIRTSENLPILSLNARESIKQGLSYNGFAVRLIGHALGRLLTGRGFQDLAGPVGVVRVVGETARLGIMPLLMLAALLSVNLALFNLLPIPILDGGWLAFLFLEGIRGKPLPPSHQGIAQFIGFLLIMLLMLFATYRDILGLV